MPTYKLTEHVLVNDTNFSLINNGRVNFGNKTQTQINALTSVVTGSIVFNTTINKEQQFDGAVWLTTSYNESIVNIEQVHTAGATVTIANSTTILYVDPASTLASLTVTLPATPVNGQEVKISFGGTLTTGTVVTTLSIIGNTGHTVLNGSNLTFADVGEGYIFKFQSSTNLWRIF